MRCFKKTIGIEFNQKISLDYLQVGCMRRDMGGRTVGIETLAGGIGSTIPRMEPPWIREGGHCYEGKALDYWQDVEICGEHGVWRRVSAIESMTPGFEGSHIFRAQSRKNIHTSDVMLR